MGRVAVDFGVGQGAKRSVDILSDLGQASNAGQRQNQRNRRRREAEGHLAASLSRYSPLKGMRLPRLQVLQSYSSICREGASTRLLILTAADCK